MKRFVIITGSLVGVAAASFLLASLSVEKNKLPALVKIDVTKIPNDKFGEQVKYGRELLLNTAKYIGPNGSAGKYLGNKMNCTNCHREAGTRAYAFNLVLSQDQYPQYRSREGRVLTLAERINNCIERPHNGKPLPLDSREMVAILSYLKWINGFAEKRMEFEGSKNPEIKFPARAASSSRGALLFAAECKICHGANGEGKMNPDQQSFLYPPLWGASAYQSGSSMHRIIKMAQWLKANMPYGRATAEKPILKDEDALDLAAFINDDRIHQRPSPLNADYPHAEEKAIDYDQGPFADGFSSSQHKFGPYAPIIEYWKAKGMKPKY